MDSPALSLHSCLPIPRPAPSSVPSCSPWPVSWLTLWGPSGAGHQVRGSQESASASPRGSRRSPGRECGHTTEGHTQDGRFLLRLPWPLPPKLRPHEGGHLGGLPVTEQRIGSGPVRKPHTCHAHLLTPVPRPTLLWPALCQRLHPRTLSQARPPTHRPPSEGHHQEAGWGHAAPFLRRPHFPVWPWL